MTVYTESNFVLELALAQEQHAARERLVLMAEETRLHLALPAYAFAEPFSAIVGRTKRRNRVAEALQAELNILGPSASYERRIAEFDDLANLLVVSQQEERTRLQHVVDRLLRTAHAIPLQDEVLRNSLRYQDTLNLSPHDAIVFASVLHHASAAEDEDKVFLNRNRRDLDDPDLVQQLDDVGCKLLYSFDAGLSYIEHRLAG